MYNNAKLDSARTALWMLLEGEEFYVQYGDNTYKVLLDEVSGLVKQELESGVQYTLTKYDWQKISTWCVQDRWYEDEELLKRGVICKVWDDYQSPFGQKIVSLVVGYTADEEYKYQASSGVSWKNATPISKQDKRIIR